MATAKKTYVRKKTKKTAARRTEKRPGYAGKWYRIFTPRRPQTQWFHDGNAIDIGAPMGTPIHAPVEGRVFRMNEPGGCGLYVKLQKKGSATYFLFCHLSAYEVPNGASVKVGQVIAKSGNSGHSTGPHLHFSYHPNGHNGNPQGRYEASYRKPWRPKG